MNQGIKIISEAVLSCLSEDIRNKKFIIPGKELSGYCYVVAEALYHCLGGVNGEWYACQLYHENISHWYLEHKRGRYIIDPTSTQFDTPIPYCHGKHRGFLTKNPSRKAKKLINRLNWERDSLIPNIKGEDNG